MLTKKIRNFCIIAHIDHGKSTLADRLLELTQTVAKRLMKEQLLDQMDLERERGITIKLQPVRMNWQGYELNLIDTPGHVDFTYEVSRSLAAVEGAILVVDATQGVEAQTLANLHLAREQNLTIIPVINKIDLPAANVDLATAEIIKLLPEVSPADILAISAKTGQGVEKLLDRLIEKVPTPKAKLAAPGSRALIFDSYFDDYRGVIAYVRVFAGNFQANDKIEFMATGKTSEVLEVGAFKPMLEKTLELSEGEIGYIVTGLKDLSEARVGDTITNYKNISALPLPGYKNVKPFVFAGVFPQDGAEFNDLRDSLEKLSLTDSAFTYEPEKSSTLGPGFRCGFLGLLHLDIFQERLRREFAMEVILTTPSVAYRIISIHDQETIIHSPHDFPEPSQIKETLEPFVKAEVITPVEYLGNIMKIFSDKRGEYLTTEYLDKSRAIVYYNLPLSSILTDFYDTIKSVSSGYASLNYEYADWRKCDLVKLDILVADNIIEALSILVYRSSAYQDGRKIVDALQQALPRQQFEVKVQASLGGKIIAAARIPALRKDVTAKLYGGDVTRKRKLLEKQKKGKKRLKAAGKVDIPQEAFLSLLKR